MDLEQPEDETTENITESGNKLVRAKDILPSAIPILPQAERPFFPGQAIPLLLDPERWGETIRAAQENANNIVGLLLLKTGRPEQATTDDFYRMGTACRIHRVGKQDGRIQVLLEGVERFRVSEWLNRRPPFTARVHYLPEPRYEEIPEVKAYAVAVINTIKELIPLNPLYGEELKLFLEHFHPNDPSHLADFAASLTTSAREEQQEVLEAVDLLTRLERVHALINKELEVAKAQARIRRQVEEDMQAYQREHILREQMKVIQKELGISKDDRTAQVDKFRERIDALQLPEAAQKRVEEEMEKFSVLETGSPEYATTRNYLDWLTQLPWGLHTEDRLDLQEARKILDEDHEGLEDIKQRIRPRGSRGHQAAHSRVHRRRDHEGRGVGLDPAVRRAAGSGQNLAGPFHCAGAGTQVLPFFARRHARRSRDQGPPAHLHRRHAGQVHSGDQGYPVRESGDHAGRDRQGGRLISR
jgi:ATP-dependent Lon protease